MKTKSTTKLLQFISFYTTSLNILRYKKLNFKLLVTDTKFRLRAMIGKNPQQISSQKIRGISVLAEVIKISKGMVKFYKSPLSGTFIRILF